jgi:cation transport ATPase
VNQLHEPPIPPNVEQVLARPPGERTREFKYRFAQSVVFGLPVLALHWLGPALGGAEAPRWTGLFQTLLAGWVVYVAAAGMIFEGAILLTRRRLTPDFTVAMIAAALYVIAFAGWAMLLLRGDAPRVPMPFHYSVILLAIWCGARWAWLARRAITAAATARSAAETPDQ